MTITPSQAGSQALQRRNSLMLVRNVLVPIAFIVLGLGIAVYTGVITVQWQPGHSADSYQALDLAAVSLPIEQPEVELHTQLSGAQPLPEQSEQVVTMRRLFFFGDFNELEAMLSAQRAEAHASTGSIRYNPFVFSLRETNLAGIDRCAEWLQELPDSYLAHWVCGSIWNSGAWDVRSNRRLNRVSHAQMTLMRERMITSNRLLERALELDPQPVEAMTQLGANHAALGTGFGEHFYALAESIAPRYLSIHRARANFAQPQWGGSEGDVRQVITYARSLGIDEYDLQNLEDEFFHRPRRLSAPGATRAYWEQAVNSHPTRQRMMGLLDDHGELRRWNETARYAQEVLAVYPEDAKAWFWLGRAHSMIGNMDDARAAMLQSAAMGYEAAIQDLLMALIRGGFGIDESYTGPGVLELCHYSAAIGSAVGANCLGGGYHEGGQHGSPFTRNPGQSNAWHLFAARAGHYNSQHDLGWMLYSRRVPDVDRDQAGDVGIYWLRRAAEKDHRFAARRLDEMNISRAEPVVGGHSPNWLQTQLYRARTYLAQWKG
ncbi:MAG: DUF4034 domain-containing protein [Pseudomonadaceae bacterium]|nr:MAG: DUF4034 domain-containing protein [Pseudomonadaceae bacterium]